MIFRVKSEEEAIQLANDSPFGPGGSVMTRDVERAKRITRQIESGMAFINRATWTAPEFLFGGVKHSGCGRELAEEDIGEFINRKLIRVARNTNLCSRRGIGGPYRCRMSVWVPRKLRLASGQIMAFASDRVPRIPQFVRT